MPSQHQMVPRIARAVERLDAAGKALADRFGIERTPVLPGRDVELQRVREQESVADLLESLLATVGTDAGDAKDAETLLRKAETDRAALTSALNACKADIDKLTAENAALTDSLDAATTPEQVGDASKAPAKTVKSNTATVVKADGKKGSG